MDNPDAIEAIEKQGRLKPIGQAEPAASEASSRGGR